MAGRLARRELPLRTLPVLYVGVAYRLLPMVLPSAIPEGRLVWASLASVRWVRGRFWQPRSSTHFRRR